MKPSAETNQGQRFLYAICQDLDDVTPRLMYADWLDDNGYPDQAGFIRSDIGLSGMEESTDSQRCQARRRELLSTYRDSWLWPLSQSEELRFDLSNWQFHRGFPSEISLLLKDYRKYVKTIFTYYPVRRVRLGTKHGRYGTLIGGGYRGVRRFYNSDWTRRGEPPSKLPNCLFQLLDRVGFPVQIQVTEASLPEGVDALEIVSRVCIAHGRELVGLPPIEWSDTV